MMVSVIQSMYVCCVLCLFQLLHVVVVVVVVVLYSCTMYG